MKTHLLSAWSRPDAVPLIWHIRDFPSQRPLMRRLLRRAGRRATLAIANSDAVATDARSVFPHPPVTTLHNMVDTEAFTPQGEAVDLDRLGGLAPAEPGTVRIGLVATYAHWKGHDVLLRAVAQLNASKHRLYLVGGPIYATAGSQFSREELTNLIHSLGLQDRVGFVPFQMATPPVYRALDVVVHASTRPEPFGLSIAEAMACGRAVIVAAGGGAAELFTDGIDALGHEPGNIDSLTRTLDRLLSDNFLRERLGTCARQTAVERFSEGPFAKNLLGIYDRCLTPPAV
jgi:glycosyltransferase involved in cell wall biosynthesis